MSMHPDILNDLAVLYQAGVASPATRDLLERESASNPELARQLVAVKDLAPIEIETPDAQRRALRSIGHWNRMHSAFCGLSVALTLIPFSFIYRTDSHELTFFLWRDFPELCAASCTLGIACAVAALRFRQLRRLV